MDAVGADEELVVDATSRTSITQGPSAYMLAFAATVNALIFSVCDEQREFSSAVRTSPGAGSEVQWYARFVSHTYPLESY